MAKHKKKKSPPTPDPEESKKVNVAPKGPEDKNSTESNENPPPSEPIQTEDDKNVTKRKLNQLFWLRVGLAVMAGIVAVFIFEPIEGEERRWASIGFMIVIFFVTIIIAKGMKMQLQGSDKKKIVTQGIGSYVFMYLFTWILTYTIFNVMGNEKGISTPLL